MRTQIDFLQKYRDDLLEAAWRESMRGPRREHRRPWQGWSRKRIVTLATAATLAISGLIGFFMLRHTNQAAPGTPSQSFAAIRSTDRLAHRPGLGVRQGVTAGPLPSPVPLSGSSGNGVADQFGIGNTPVTAPVPATGATAPQAQAPAPVG